MSDSQGSDSQGHANGKALQQGLIVLGLILFGGYLLFDRGLMGVLLEGDKSRLSWLILAIWVAMSGRWLHLLRRMEGDTGPIDEDDMARWLPCRRVWRWRFTPLWPG